MSKTFVTAFGIGIVCIAIAIGAVFYMQRGSKIEVAGKVLKVRTAPLDEKSSIAVVDFRLNNPADFPFMVRSVTVTMEDAAGKKTEGQTSSGPDANRVLEGIPLLGPKINQPMMMRDKIPPRTSWDRMVVARFEVPDDQLQARKRFIVRVEEMDGPVFEFVETR